MWSICEQNCVVWKLRSLFTLKPSKSFFNKTGFWSEFFYDIPPSPIFGSKMWHVSMKNCHGAKLRSLLPKTLGNRFSDWCVSRPYFFMKLPPHPFFGPNRLFGVFRGKIFLNVKFAHFMKFERKIFLWNRPLTLFLWNSAINFFIFYFLFIFFSLKKKHFGWIFSRPNDLCGAFQGKIVTEENFARFYLTQPRNHFSEWRVARLYFLRNRSITYFRGQMTYMARFEAKLSRKQTSLAFLPKTPPKSFFQMAHFEEVFFYETAPSPIFGTKWTMWCILRQNCCRRKVQSFLPKMPPKSFFRKTHFRSEFFYYIAPSPIFRAKNDCGAFQGESVTEKTLLTFA